MSEPKHRIEHDSMGEVRVPSEALWGAQTQRACDNFPVSGWRMPQAFIRGLGLIKASAAEANRQLGLLDDAKARAIVAAAERVAGGAFDDEFPVDVFQTGSGTSTNMNANEVIARLASSEAGIRIHPNDDVNLGQSSNDVIPTAIHVSAALALQADLLPALERLQATIERKAAALDAVVKTGRTHLMDAMPITLGQELRAWAAQIGDARERIESSRIRLHRLPQGGTAVGTGVNAHPDLDRRFCAQLSGRTGLDFRPMENKFVGLACQDTAVELSGQLRTLAVGLMKIANDLRWMNSGPLTGLAEIELCALQPGSSIMPGKVNPVIPEAVAMVCAQVMGQDATIAVAGQSGNFQLNVMLPVIAFNLLNSINILANAANLLGDRAIADFTVNSEHMAARLAHNPILVTALNRAIGYERGAAIAKRAYAEGRPVIEVAAEMTELDRDTLEHLLDPARLTTARDSDEGHSRKE